MELKANELRIGNLINDEQTTHIVVGVDNYYIESYWLKDEEKETLYKTPIKLIKPIPLTEEWLLKFGFIYDLDNYFKLGIFYLDKNFEPFVTDIEDDFWYHYGVKLDYVHQLQNLYFALTNKELEIKM